MGADIKLLRTRIKSVNSTLHLTKAMGLVASSKIRRANDAMFKSREYLKSVERITELLAGCNECKKSPYMRNSGSGRDLLVVIAGDRGLAGGYNANVFRTVAQYKDAEILPIGKRACERYSGEICSSERFSFDDASALSAKLCERFASGEISRIGIVTTKYVSMLSQQPFVKWVLPLTFDESKKSSGAIFEPDEESIFKTAVPQYVAGVLISAVRESFACEVAARRMAMDSAGKNASQMIDELQISYNRARQGAITQEITEIVAGSGS